MKLRKIMICAAVLVLFTVSGKAAQKNKCTDPSLEVTIVPIDGSALSGDSKGSVYTNGVDGVSNTVIHLCASNNGVLPTYDATMSLSSTSQRSMGFTFPPDIEGSIISGPSPVWANGVRFMAKPFLLNVRNILWGRKAQIYTFTTRMIFEGFAGPGDKALYDLRFQPAVVDALQNAPPFADTNLPSETSTVTVQDIPGTCRTTQGGTLDSWIVTVDPLFVGTVHKQDRSHTHSGQYNMPIQLLLKAKTCLPF